jgi:membrane associated rhomboid family serine protease
VDFGLVHFALTNLGLFIVGAEAEALLGTVPFLCVYGLSASAGGIASMASDASKLTGDFVGWIDGKFLLITVWANSID